MNLKKCSTLGLLVSVFLSLVSIARADVRLPHLFSSNMVLQQGAKIEVWGWADDGEEVTVSFRGKTVKTVAKNGEWKVQLGKLKAGGPDTMMITGKNAITLNNVLVGEVWVCSGQSNMEFALKNSTNSQPDIEASANPRIRLFHVPRLRTNQPTNDVDATWEECGPATVPDFTAVGYYFGRDLEKSLNVPIGLIESSWGGTPAEAWTREGALASNPRYQREILEPAAAKEKKYEADLQAYDKQKEAAKASGKAFKKRAPGKPWQGGELYNGMIAPLVNYRIRGAIWYQGENNAPRAAQYHTLFPDMISNWRHDWQEGNFPFLCVQLAPFMAIKDQPGESSWAELREAQLLATKVLPKVGIAVITDVGNPNNIHPTQKEPVGARLALAARGIAYDEHLEYSGPIYKSVKFEGNKAVLAFNHVGSGLEARGGDLKGFAVCGQDKKWFWATATIDGKNRIVVSAPEVQKPIAVRYGWADCPVVNLWNKEGLPASPFRTDDFPMITDKN